MPVVKYFYEFPFQRVRKWFFSITALDAKKYVVAKSVSLEIQCKGGGAAMNTRSECLLQKNLRVLKFVYCFRI